MTKINETIIYLRDAHDIEIDEAAAVSFIDFCKKVVKTTDQLEVYENFFAYVYNNFDEYTMTISEMTDVLMIVLH